MQHRKVHGNYFEKRGYQIKALETVTSEVEVIVCEKVIKAQMEEEEDQTDISINSSNFLKSEVEEMRIEVEQQKAQESYHSEVQKDISDNAHRDFIPSPGSTFNQLEEETEYNIKVCKVCKLVTANEESAAQMHEDCCNASKETDLKFESIGEVEYYYNTTANAVAEQFKAESSNTRTKK